MSVIVLLAGAALIVLAWIGRRPRRLANLPSLASLPRLAAALVAAVAAAAAVASALRGGWIASLVLVGLSAWVAQAARSPRPSSAPGPGMSLAEARAVLGVQEGADRAEIEAAYRRLMRRAHPDAGGSPGLAVQLNAARERLLGRGGSPKS